MPSAQKRTKFVIKSSKYRGGGYRRIRDPVNKKCISNQRQIEEIAGHYETYKQEGNILGYLRAIGYRYHLETGPPPHAPEARWTPVSVGTYFVPFFISIGHFTRVDIFYWDLCRCGHVKLWTLKRGYFGSGLKKWTFWHVAYLGVDILSGNRAEGTDNWTLISAISPISAKISTRMFNGQVDLGRLKIRHGTHFCVTRPLKTDFDVFFPGNSGNLSNLPKFWCTI